MTWITPVVCTVGTWSVAGVIALVRVTVQRDNARNRAWGRAWQQQSSFTLPARTGTPLPLPVPVPVPMPVPQARQPEPADVALVAESGLASSTAAVVLPGQQPTIAPPAIGDQGGER